MNKITKNPFRRNTWTAKLKRSFTSVLPADKKRKGNCLRCGACCKLPNKCLFLAKNGSQEYYCKIHPFRPLNCRKYPRTYSEHITTETCGFTFDNVDWSNNCLTRSFFVFLLLVNIKLPVVRFIYIADFSLHIFHYFLRQRGKFLLPLEHSLVAWGKHVQPN